MAEASRPSRLERWLPRIRWTALVALVVGPVVIAAWEVRSVGRFGGPAAPEAHRAYFAERNPLINELLPAGEAGIRVVDNLGGPMGLANMNTGAIALDRSVAHEGWRGAVELHERAHLIEAFLPREVAALMARLPSAPGPGVASEGPGQHFAEMASEAWQLVTDPHGMCIDGTPEARLKDAEARVPGTSGFVLWYLRHPALSTGDRAVALRTAAALLVAPNQTEWTTLWDALDAQRDAAGAFRPWPAPTVRSILSRQWARVLSASPRPGP